MADIVFSASDLTDTEQAALMAGFAEHSAARQAPVYDKQPVKWLMHDETGELTAALAGHILWDWMYIDDLWVASHLRQRGTGKALMLEAEEHALETGLSGIWLWTQSWQAEPFYQRLGYEVFARFDNHPKGYQRIGLRKALR